MGERKPGSGRQPEAPFTRDELAEFFKAARPTTEHGRQRLLIRALEWRLSWKDENGEIAPEKRKREAKLSSKQLDDVIKTVEAIGRMARDTEIEKRTRRLEQVADIIDGRGKAGRRHRAVGPPKDYVPHADLPVEEPEKH